MIYGDNPQKINEREDKLGLKTYSYVPQLLSILQAGNLYVYCVSNPIMLCDPSGKLACQMAPDGSSSQLHQLGFIMAFSAGLFIAGATVIVGQNIFPPIIWAKEKKATFKVAETPELESGPVAASPASPLPPDDDDRNIITEKIRKQMKKRGWTDESINGLIDDPYTTRDAINKANGNPATAYYNESGHYVVRDNITGEIIQISNIFDPYWFPDSTIINPFIP